MVSFTIPPDIREDRRKVSEFMKEHVYPNEAALTQEDDTAEALMKELQAKVKAMGMWAPFIGPEAGGSGRGFLPYAYIERYMMDAWSSVDIDDPNPLTLASVLNYKDRWEDR